MINISFNFFVEVFMMFFFLVCDLKIGVFGGVVVIGNLCVGGWVFVGMVGIGVVVV